MTTMSKALDWIEEHRLPGTSLVPQEPYDALCESDPELAAGVAGLLGEFRTVDRGEYAYARVSSEPREEAARDPDRRPRRGAVGRGVKIPVIPGTCRA
jgi:hypothetical protein